MLLDALESAGLVHHRRHDPSAINLPAQEAAAGLLINDPVYCCADWAMWLDADEFLLPLSMPDVSALIAEIDNRNADGIALPWRNFGHSGHHEVPQGLVIENYTMTAAGTNRTERTYKCLYRTTSPIAKLYPHRPYWAGKVKLLGPDLSQLPEETVVKLKGNGRPDELLPRGMSSVNRAAQVNHYPVKALRRFLLKRQRKSALGNVGRFSDEYLNRFDVNEISRTEIIDVWAGRVRCFMANALDNTRVRQAYNECVSRFEERLRQTDLNRLLDAIDMKISR